MFYSKKMSSFFDYHLNCVFLAGNDHFHQTSTQHRIRTMQNDAGEFVDLYCPRKCSASNRIIHAKDHASIQISLVDVDPGTGKVAETMKHYALCGSIRRMGESDDCLVRLAKRDGILSKNF